MSIKPIISILMPVYNAGTFLEECLHSILAQTDSHWELLAIDDYSTDESWPILERFSRQDNRIRCFKNKIKGISPALRLAFEKSTGTWITRMDADDRMEDSKLMELRTILEINGTGTISTGWVKYFSETELGNGYQKYESWLNGLCEKNNHYEEIYRECVVPSPCWMAWKSDLIQCKAFQEDRYPEDYDLSFLFYENNLKVASIQKILHYWRDHQNRTSRTSETYANQQYFDLKLPYFLKLDYDQNRPLVLWGAGRKGKYLAKKLQKSNVSFHWITNNERKQEVKINGIILKAVNILDTFSNPQLIIAVAAPDGQREIQAFLTYKKWSAGKDYFFFC